MFVIFKATDICGVNILGLCNAENEIDPRASLLLRVRLFEAWHCIIVHLELTAKAKQYIFTTKLDNLFIYYWIVHKVQEKQHTYRHKIKTEIRPNNKTIQKISQCIDP